MTVSTRCAQVLTGINPQGIFGSFLGKQKGTPVPSPSPAPQGEPHKKGGSDETCHSHKHFPYGRRRETKFPRKFFAKLSFKKAG